MRKVARECVRDGVDQLKSNLSGDNSAVFARGEVTPTNDDEVAVLVEGALDFGKMAAAESKEGAPCKDSHLGAASVDDHLSKPRHGPCQYSARVFRR